MSIDLKNITFEDKVALQDDVSIPDVNKIKDSDLNELKNNINLNNDAIVLKFNSIDEEQKTQNDRLTALENKPSKINVLFGWEPNNEGNYYRENAYDLVFPNEVIDSNKRFMAIFYFGTQRDNDYWWDSVTLPYSYYNTDKYKQIAELIEQVGKNYRDNNERIRAVIYRGRLKAVDSWRGDNQGVLYGIRFIEI